MRVAVFTDNDFDKVNGVTTTWQAVLAHAPEDVRPTVFTAADLESDQPGYHAYRTAGFGLPWYRAMRVHRPPLFALSRDLRHLEPSVIHVVTPGPMGVAGRWLAARHRLPLVGSFHTHLGDYARLLSGSALLGRTMDEYLRWFYAPCRYLLVPSRATAHLLAGRGYAAERIGLWTRGVDSARFSPARRSAALRSRWRVDATRPAVLYAGRLSREKGLDLVAEVASQLRRRRVAHRLIFVGDGPLRRALEARCPEACFMGTLTHDQTAEAMASADAFFFPSATDSLGNVVLEAQASGLPVVVSDRGGPAQNIVPGETGLISQAGDATDFADRLDTILSSEARRALMARAARDYALTRRWPSALEPLATAWRHAAALAPAVERRGPALARPAARRP